MDTVTADRKIAQPAWKPKTVPLEEIIAEARSRPAGARGALALACATGILMWASFTPLDLGALGWVCLAPLCLLLRLERPTRAMYRSVYAGGLLFWIASLQWMRLGDPAMYWAWGALSAYMAVFVPLFVWLARTAVWRFRVPITLAAPVVWTGLELFRGFFMTGFAWYFLGHSQHRFASLVQICDLCGVYGVSFLLAAFGACAAEMAPQQWFARLGLLSVGSPDGVQLPTPFGRVVRLGCCTALFVAACTYGVVRRSGDDFPAGPRVAAQCRTGAGLHRRRQPQPPRAHRQRDLGSRRARPAPEGRSVSRGGCRAVPDPRDVQNGAVHVIRGRVHGRWRRASQGERTDQRWRGKPNGLGTAPADQRVRDGPARAVTAAPVPEAGPPDAIGSDALRGRCSPAGRPRRSAGRDRTPRS